MRLWEAKQTLLLLPKPGAWNLLTLGNSPVGPGTHSTHRPSRPPPFLGLRSVEGEQWVGGHWKNQSSCSSPEPGRTPLHPAPVSLGSCAKAHVGPRLPSLARLPLCLLEKCQLLLQSTGAPALLRCTARVAPAQASIQLAGSRLLWGMCVCEQSISVETATSKAQC